MHFIARGLERCSIRRYRAAVLSSALVSDITLALGKMTRANGVVATEAPRIAEACKHNTADLLAVGTLEIQRFIHTRFSTAPICKD